MAMSMNGDRLDQFQEGNTAGSDAGEVQAVPYPVISPSMTSRRIWAAPLGVTRYPQNEPDDRTGHCTD
jgi:hypothetical protein